MDETEREELKEAYRKEKDPRVVARMLAAHMVYVRKASIDETAVHLMRSARWVRNWLHRYDEGVLRASGIFPGAAGSCRPAAEMHHQTTHRRSTKQSRQI